MPNSLCDSGTSCTCMLGGASGGGDPTIVRHELEPSAGVIHVLRRLETATRPTLLLVYSP